MPTPSKLTKRRSATALDRVARAADALRRGEGVVVKGKPGLVAWAVETAPEAALAEKSAQLLITHARARTLKIRLYTPKLIALPVPRSMTMREARAIADPTADLDFPLKGPFETSRDPLPEAAEAAVKLAKLAGLLPACIVRRGKLEGAL